jgi:hypothetical protein
MGMIDWLANPHGIQVVRELLRAIETYDIGFSMSDAVLADWSNRPSEVPMRTVE